MLNLEGFLIDVVKTPGNITGRGSQELQDSSLQPMLLLIQIQLPLLAGLGVEHYHAQAIAVCFNLIKLKIIVIFK